MDFKLIIAYVFLLFNIALIYAEPRYVFPLVYSFSLLGLIFSYFGNKNKYRVIAVLLHVSLILIFTFDSLAMHTA